MRAILPLLCLSAVLGAADLASERHTVNDKAVPVSSKSEIRLRVRDNDKDVKNRELWYRSFDGDQWGAWSKHGITFGPETPITWAPTEGHWQVYVRIEEVSGLTMPEPDARTTPSAEFIIDRTPPSVAIDFPADKAELKAPGTYTIRWSASDPHLHSSPVTIRWARSAGAEATVLVEHAPNTGRFEWTTPMDMTDAGKLEVLVADKALNLGSAQSSNIVIDAVAPSARVNGPSISADHALDLAIRATDAGPAGLASVTLHYSADNGTTWNKGPVLTAPAGDGTRAFSPTVLPWRAPADGTYLLYLVATDEAGNTSPTPKGTPTTAATLIIDTTAPKISLASPIGIVDEQADKDAAPRRVYKPGDKVRVDFTIQDKNIGPGAVTVALMADKDARWQTVGQNLDPSTPYVFAIPDISTTAARIKVEATDTAGNVGAIAAKETFRVDNKVEAGNVEVDL